MMQMNLYLPYIFACMVVAQVLGPDSLLAQSIDTAVIYKPLKIDEEHPDPTQMDKPAVIKLVNWFIRGDCRKGVPAENFEPRSAGLFPRMPGVRADDCVDNYEYNALLRKRLVALAGNWSSEIQQSVITVTFTKGMNPEMIVAMYGEPHREHRVKTEEKVLMQWVYELGGKRRYLYFENGTALAVR